LEFAAKLYSPVLPMGCYNINLGQLNCHGMLLRKFLVRFSKILYKS